MLASRAEGSIFAKAGFPSHTACKVVAFSFRGTATKCRGAQKKFIVSNRVERLPMMRNESFVLNLRFDG